MSKDCVNIVYCESYTRTSVAFSSPDHESYCPEDEGNFPLKPLLFPPGLHMWTVALRRGQWGPDELLPRPSSDIMTSTVETSLPVCRPSQLFNWVYMSLQDHRRSDTGGLREDIFPGDLKTHKSITRDLRENYLDNIFHLSSELHGYDREVSHRGSPPMSHNNIVDGLSTLADNFSELSLSCDSHRPSKQLPPNYLCHLCFTKGHYIRDCPQGRPKRKGLTPYQGKVRCFGEYKCPKCKRKWKSANSWANMGQDCIKCHINVYPNKQRPLEKQDKPVDHTKEHPQQLCEKCKVLGFYCRDTQ